MTRVRPMPSRSPRPLLPVVLLALVLALPPAQALGETVEVRGINHRGNASMFFEPDFLAIQPGDRITFTVAEFDHLPRSVFVPEGAEHWEAEPGQSVTVTFDKEGIYVFDCDYHNVMGMAGVVLVGEPVNLEAARAFFERYREDTFAMNADRLDRLWTPDTGVIARAGRER